MKKTLFAVIIITTIFTVQGFAQSSGQSLLNAYYGIKDALIAADANTASLKAAEFSKSLNDLEATSLSTRKREEFNSLKDKLTFDATHIEDQKDIHQQREHFANFSQNFFKLAKSVKLTAKPIYYAYCPMKKGYWLSDTEAIKNPYYGKQMLTCGTVKETLK